MILQGIHDLVLIRHGESVKNIAEKFGPYYKNNEERKQVGIAQDRLMPLSENGFWQARKAGRSLKKLFGAPDFLFHSGFLRTKQTTSGILKAYSEKELLKTKIQESHLIRERNPGYLWNFTEAEVREIFPWWQNYLRCADPFLTALIGGESMVSICEGRLLTFLKSLENISYQKGGNKIFVVSHGRAILGMRYLLEDWGYERINQALVEENPPNCSATYYKIDAFGKPHLQFANKVFSSH